MPDGPTTPKPIDLSAVVSVEPVIYSPGSCRCGHPKHPAQCFSDHGCWCDTFTPDCPTCGARPGNAHRDRSCIKAATR